MFICLNLFEKLSVIEFKRDTGRKRGGVWERGERVSVTLLSFHTSNACINLDCIKLKPVQNAILGLPGGLQVPKHLRYYLLPLKVDFRRNLGYEQIRILINRRFRVMKCDCLKQWLNTLCQKGVLLENSPYESNCEQTEKNSHQNQVTILFYFPQKTL